jgi:membrane-bound lytic murein transglycosylase B
MPSSQRNYAVDFDGDDRIDLRGSAADAIGSVARFLSLHGWQTGQPIAVPASVNGDPLPLIAAGIKPEKPVRDLAEYGVGAVGDDPQIATLPAALIDLVTPEQPTEYWIGFDNFYVITRYNRSSFYAMSVFLLADALREAHAARLLQASPR